MTRLPADPADLLGRVALWAAERTAAAVQWASNALADLEKPRAPAAENPYEPQITWAIERWIDLLEKLPGATVAERSLLRVLKTRLDGVSGALPEPARQADAQHGNGASPPSVFGTAPVAPMRDLGQQLQEILERSLDLNARQSRRLFFATVLERLTPDEARILAALADGSSYPLIHIGWGSPFGELKRRVQDNVSSVGRSAGVTMPDLVPRYIVHLRELELVETGPEDASLGVKYEIVETDAVAREAMKKIEAAKRTPRVVRRTLRISPLGQELWDACMRADEES